MKKKSPFVTYTTDEILESEVDSYIIQMGRDLFSTARKLTFSKKAAENYYSRIILALEDQIKNGNKKEKKKARNILKNFRILPLRFH